MSRSLNSSLILLSFLTACIMFSSRSNAAEGPTAADVVSKHLDSIGPAKARAEIKSRADEGTIKFRILSGGGGGVLSGKSVFLSEGYKTLFMMKLSNTEYQGERFIFDGNRTEIRGATAQQSRSALGDFVWVQDALLKEGLLGGVLTTAWPLLNVDERKAKVSLEGTKTIDGKQLIDLRYEPKKKSDLEIHLYFDPETFRHVRSVYSLKIAGGLGRGNPVMGLPTRSAEISTAHQNETRYRLEEEFSDFATVDGLSLPMHYTLQFTREQQSGRTVLSQWDNTFSAIKHNVSPDARNFEVK